MDESTDTRTLPTKGPAWRAAEEYGFDMSLIECSLRLTPAERIRQHSQALRTAMLLRAGVEKHYGQLEAIKERLEGGSSRAVGFTPTHLTRNTP